MLRCVRTRSTGFTLIDLAIVLVIIGLVVGGVLVGRDLIAAAEVRKFISQIEQYNTAANTFKAKYGALPGDIKNGAEYGLTGAGNGDGCIGLCNPGSVISDLYLGTFSGNAGYGENEMSLFWSMLSNANLIAGRYDGATADFTASPIGITIPATAIDGTIGLLAYYGTESPQFGRYSNRNYITMTSYAPTAFQLFFDLTTQPNRLKTVWAQSMDRKIDDGSPGGGRVRAAGRMDGFIDQVVVNGDNSFSLTPPLPAGQVCTYVPASSTDWVYNVTDTAAGCWLRFDAAF